MLNLTINGQPQSCDADTIGALLHHLHLAQSQVAVRLNGSIVPRAALLTSLFRTVTGWNRSFCRRRLSRPLFNEPRIPWIS
ncbi:MAG: sulfur carrier protein ThiS [Syntrophotaleaceae bacterium]